MFFARYKAKRLKLSEGWPKYPIQRRVAIVKGGANALRIAEEVRDIIIADLEDGNDIVKKVETLRQRGIYIKTGVSDEAAVHAVIDKTMGTFWSTGYLNMLRWHIGEGKTVS